jgi:hypothetical protein
MDVAAASKKCPQLIAVIQIHAAKLVEFGPSQREL